MADLYKTATKFMTKIVGYYFDDYKKYRAFIDGEIVNQTIKEYNKMNASWINKHGEKAIAIICPTEHEVYKYMGCEFKDIIFINEPVSKFVKDWLKSRIRSSYETR